MKILLIRTSSAENTVFKNSYNEQEVGLAKELTKLGHECGIVYYAKKGNKSIQKLEINGSLIKIYNIEGKEFLKSAIYNEEIYDLCEEYDILQVYECDKIMTWLIYSKYFYKTIIYHGPYEARYTWKHNFYSKIFYKIFLNKNNYFNAHIITKSFLAEKYLKKQGFKNVKTIGVGLDTSKFSNSIDNQYSDEFFRKIKKDNKHLLYIGKIEPRRNIKFLIDIISELKKENIRLVIVGNGNPKYLKKIYSYAMKKNVSDGIIYTKSIKQNEIQYLYKKCDVFLLPTRYEIFGMVLLEAMYFGIPVITTYNGGSSTIMENGQNGFICNTFDKALWKKNIYNIIKDHEEFIKISENAKKTIKTKYTWSAMVNKFLEEYNKALNGENNGES